ncbi:hypothetical protein GS911_22755 [Rhodococcus hoagii]|nr:hypothetical protein [Prescottella equi]
MQRLAAPGRADGGRGHGQRPADRRPSDENVTPYAWALDAHAAMGGRLLTIEDAAHGSTVGSSCRGLVTEFLDTGRLSRGTCEPH